MLIYLFVKRDVNVNVSMRGNSELEICFNVNKIVEMFCD